MNKKDFATRALNKILDTDNVEFNRAWLESMSMKCNDYQQFYPGFRFLESLSSWLNQFDNGDIPAAFDFVRDRLIYISEAQIRLLVESVFSMHIRPLLLDAVANQTHIPIHKRNQLANHPLYSEALTQSLFLGLSDGARTDAFRRFNPQLDNEQVWLTYSVSEEKYTDFADYLKQRSPNNPTFNHLWLIDDFSASGKSFVRKDKKTGKWKGKIVKTLKAFLKQEITEGKEAATPILGEKCKVYIVLYIASSQAEEYFETEIEKLWKEQQELAKRFDIPKLIVVQSLNTACRISSSNSQDEPIIRLIEKDKYYDHAKLYNKASEVGETREVRFGFAEGRLPLVLGHNTPNNSVSLLWSFETAEFVGLFPRVSRH